MWRYYLRIAVLLKNLQLNKFEGADFKYDNSFFLILPPKYANIAFLVPNLGIFVFHKNWQLEKFEGAENRTIHFWTSSLKIPKSGNFPSKFRDLYFAPNFALRQIWRRWFQIWQWLFRIPAQKYPNKAFFVVNVSIFYFYMKLPIMKNLRVLISKMAIVFFQIPAKNTKIRNFLWKLKFFLSATLSELNFI